METGIILEDITTDYERIADHCNNIAVHLAQKTEDGFDTHEYLQHLEHNAREDFRTYVSLFEARYRLPAEGEENGKAGKRAVMMQGENAASAEEDKKAEKKLPAAEKAAKKIKEKKERKKNAKKEQKKKG